MNHHGSSWMRWTFSLTFFQKGEHVTLSALIDAHNYFMDKQEWLGLSTPQQFDFCHVYQCRDYGLQDKYMINYTFVEPNPLSRYDIKF
jgi:hypothetical protein